MNDIYQRISNIQQHVDGVTRTTEGYGYKYATLADVWNLVKEGMAANNLGWTATTSPHLQQVGDMLTIYNEFTIRIFCTDKDNEELTTSYLFEAAGAQTVGSYETYYRRYALLSLLGLTTITDDDGANTIPIPQPITEFN